MIMCKEPWKHKRLSTKLSTIWQIIDYLSKKIDYRLIVDIIDSSGHPGFIKHFLKCYLGQIPTHQILFRTTLYCTNNYYTKYFLGILRSRPTSDDRWRLVNNMVEAKECGKQDAESLHKSSGVNKLSNYKEGAGFRLTFFFFSTKDLWNWKETANCTSKKLGLISYWNSNLTWL